MLSQSVRHVLKRRLPFGLFSWRFLLPGQASAIRRHRQLIMHHHPRIPRWLWFWIMLFAGLRWMLCYSVSASYRAVSYWSDQNDLPANLSFWQVLRAVFAHAVGHGIAPADWRRFQLYRLDRHWADFVYDQEAAAYHNRHNGQRPDHRQHQALLSDKWQLEHYLASQRVISPYTLRHIGQHSPDLDALLQDLVQNKGRLFCKRGTGNQGIGAFYADWVQHTLQVQPLHAAVLAADQVADFLQAHIAQSDYLIQPCYPNHPLLSTSDPNRPAITLRVISCLPLDPQPIDLMGAYLEWPVLQENGAVAGYLCCAVDVKTGQLLPERTFPEPSRLPTSQQTAWHHFAQPLRKTSLPHWQQVVHCTQQAHRRLPGIYRIAWDFILTEERAVLLEGNVGWRVSTPQLICPGFRLI